MGGNPWRDSRGPSLFSDWSTRGVIIALVAMIILIPLLNALFN